LGKLQISFNDNKKAIKTLEKAMEFDKKKFLSKKLLAKAYLNLGEYNKALKYLLEVKKFYSNKEEIYLDLVKIYNKQKKYKKLFLICKEGLQMLPDSKDLRYCVAKGLNRNKKYRESLYNLEYLVNQYPDSYEINFLMGEVLENFSKLIASEPEQYKQIAMGIDYLKKFKPPIEYYTLAFRLNPISHEVIKKIIGSMTENAIEKAEDTDEAAKKEFRERTKIGFLKYYEPFVQRENIEINNFEFYKKFKKYLKTKSDSYIKEMKYLQLGTTILNYISFLNKQDDLKLFDKFMNKYSKNYIRILNTKHGFNKFLYKFDFEKINKKIEQFKVYDFMIPGYFD
jgi:tetratricopeptide (TPR) repeat protein